MKFRITAVALVALFTIPSTLACFAMVALESLVQGSPVIVKGTIETIDVAEGPEPEGKRLYDTGYITVTRLLKSKLKDTEIKVGDKLPLAMPSKNSKMRISTDIYYKVGSTGIWILDFKDGKYWATYPGDLQPAEKEAEIAAMIPKELKKNAEK